MRRISAFPSRGRRCAASASALALASGKISFASSPTWSAHRLLFWAATTLMAVAMLVVSFAAGLPMLVVGMALGAFAMGSYLPLGGAMVVSRFGMHDFGRVMGLMTIFIQTSALAPFVAGLLRDSLGDYRAAFLTMLLPLFPAMLAMSWLSAERRQPPPSPELAKDAP